MAHLKQETLYSSRNQTSKHQTSKHIYTLTAEVCDLAVPAMDRTAAAACWLCCVTRRPRTAERQSVDDNMTAVVEKQN